MQIVLRLYDADWNSKTSGVARQTYQNNKCNVQKLLPLCSDTDISKWPMQCPKATSFVPRDRHLKITNATSFVHQCPGTIPVYKEGRNSQKRDLICGSKVPFPR